MTIYPIIFTSFFILVGIAVSTFGFFNLKKAKATRNWPTTEGVIVKSIVESGFDSDSDTIYSARIDYDFSVRGKDYSDHRGQIGRSSSSSNRDSAEKTVSKYTPGATVVVAYNPKDPSDAVLETAVSMGVYLLLAFGLFITVFSAVMLRAFMNF